MDRQLAHFEVKNNTHCKNIIVICDGVNSPDNIGMIFRISEAFGVSKILLNGIEGNELSHRAKRVSRSAFKNIAYEYYLDIEDCLASYKNYKVIGLEITKDSSLISDFSFKELNDIVVVIGAESSGISDAVLSICDIKLHIPMFGVNTSINVSNSLAIALYEVVR